MSIKVLGKYQGRSYHVAPGDSVMLMVDGKSLVREDITKPMTIDTAIAFQFEDEFGLVEGVGGVFGKAKERLK